MQNPNEDTEWNDVLRAKGIIGPRETEISEDTIVNLVEQAVNDQTREKDLSELTLDELNENEDDIDEDDERIFEQYRRQRLLEMRAKEANAKYGDVRDISKTDYVREVNQAGDGIWVILHVYKNGVPLCKLMNQHLENLARKFPETKFLRSISSVCIPNYPDKNLPTVFIYCDGEMKKQFVGPIPLGGMNITQDQLEWMLSEVGAVQTELEEPPKKEIKDVMNIAIRQSNINDNDDSEDD